MPHKFPCPPRRTTTTHTTTPSAFASGYRADGSTVPLWQTSQDTRTQKIADTELFKDVKVRVIDAGQLRR